MKTLFFFMLIFANALYAMEFGENMSTSLKEAFINKIKIEDSTEKKSAILRVLQESCNATLLHIAVLKGEDFTKEHNVYLNSPDSDGETPLHWAARCNNVKIISALVVEANINATNKQSITPLFLATCFGLETAVCSLLSANPNPQLANALQRTPLHQAAIKGHASIAGHLIGAGADVNARDYQQWTPLHFAADRGETEIVKLLLRNKKVKKKLKTDQRKTARQLAKEKGHTDIAKLLK